MISGPDVDSGTWVKSLLEVLQALTNLAQGHKLERETGDLGEVDPVRSNRPVGVGGMAEVLKGVHPILVPLDIEGFLPDLHRNPQVPNVVGFTGEAHTRSRIPCRPTTLPDLHQVLS